MAKLRRCHICRARMGGSFEDRRLIELVELIPPAEPKIEIVLPQTTSIRRRASRPMAFARAGAVQFASIGT